jgi:hypothetical protein
MKTAMGYVHTCLSIACCIIAAPGLSAASEGLLVVSGTITRSGAVTILHVDRTSNAGVSTSSGGDLALYLRDARGNILTQRVFAADFGVDDAGSAFSLKIAPFVLSIPYAAGATTIEISRGRKVLSRTSVVGALLREAVQSLPTKAFKRTPERGRQVLLSRIRECDRQLLANNIDKARSALQRDVRESVAEWLTDYGPQTPLEYTKARILALVDELVEAF